MSEAKKIDVVESRRPPRDLVLTWCRFRSSYTSELNLIDEAPDSEAAQEAYRKLEEEYMSADK